MKKRFLYFVFLLFAIKPALAQDITRRDADSMLKTLNKTSAGIDRIDLLLKLAQFYIFKPGENQIDFDSAMVYINKAKELNNSLKSPTAYGYLLLTESYLIKEKGQKEESKKMVEKAISILKTGNNRAYLGSAYFELSMYYDYDDSLQLPQKITLVNQSIDAFDQAGDIERKGHSLEMLGDLYVSLYEYPKAIQFLQQALTAYQSIKHQNVQGVYILMGDAYMDQKNQSQALFYMLKALRTARLVNDTSMQLCHINNTLGSLYAQIDRREMEIRYKTDALEIAKKYNDGFTIFLLATNIALTYDILNHPGQALKMLASIPEAYRVPGNSTDKAMINIAYFKTYLTLNDYGKAQSFCDTLLMLANNKMVSIETSIAIHRLAANFFIYTKQYSKAQYYLMKNTDLAKQIRFGSGLIEDSRLWYKLDSARGNFQSAFNHLLFFKTKRDSISSETRVKQLQVLGIEYETAAKEDSIKLQDKDILLLKQQNTLQQADLRQERFIRNTTIAGIILASLIIGLLYRQYRHKQKSNEVISNKNELLEHFLKEKEWLLKEIHHRVKNNLQIVMSLLNSQSAYIENDAALTAIHDSQRRVHAMSLIHQKLYNTENVSSINMSSYIHELISYLSDSFNLGKHVRFECNIADLELDVSQAVPLGLVLNEAITNSIKYAFPGGRDGVISILIKNVTPNNYLLIISDDGIGMPLNFKDKKAGSLGMSLMAGLSEDLNGNFSIENNNGTTIKISFLQDLAIDRPGVPVSSFTSSH